MGVLIYYFVAALSGRMAWIVGLGLLSLVAAGMLSQAVLLLIQADWLPSIAVMGHFRLVIREFCNRAAAVCTDRL